MKESLAEQFDHITQARAMRSKFSYVSFGNLKWSNDNVSDTWVVDMDGIDGTTVVDDDRMASLPILFYARFETGVLDI